MKKYIMAIMAMCDSGGLQYGNIYFTAETLNKKVLEETMNRHRKYLALTGINVQEGKIFCTFLHQLDE